MPWHVHPAIRALEEAEESEGLIQTRDTVGVTLSKNKVIAGTLVKVVPVVNKHIFRGNLYTAS